MNTTAIVITIVASVVGLGLGALFYSVMRIGSKESRDEEKSSYHPSEMPNNADVPKRP